MPPGLSMGFPVDNTQFVRLSIKDVVFTLLEAIGLVVVVMFVFLQNWRVTLIPALAVPVVLLGTFGVLAAFGYSINTLTMFAMVLAIGLLVDDAIVVVENVERIMDEEGLSPREATLKSMGEITGALVGIGLVLSAVFLPMAFLGGSTGVIYRQFSVTIVSAVVLSVIVALVLTPALCATILKPIDKEKGHKNKGFFGWFNRTFDGTVKRYSGLLGTIIARPWPIMIIYGAVVAAMVLLFVTLPSSFLPDEDQGFHGGPDQPSDRSAGIAHARDRRAHGAIFQEERGRERRRHLQCRGLQFLRAGPEPRSALHPHEGLERPKRG